MRPIRQGIPAFLIAAAASIGFPLYAAVAEAEAPAARAAAGDPAAEVAWGKHLLDSNDPAAKASSTEWFRKAATQSDPEGQWMFGSAYMAGIGVPHDTSVGLDWMRKSLAHGTPDHMATYGLTLVMMNSVAGTRSDGIEWLRRSIEAGSAQGMLGMGMLQVSGMPGIAKDPAAAEQSIRKAAELGLVDAQAVLGQLYLSNTLGKTDIPEALHWLDAAAKQGRADVQGTLGYFLITGDRGVPKDPARGVTLAKQSVTQNAATGYYALGTAFLTGSGETKDPAQAWYNFAVAARLDRKHQFDKVADRMSDAATQLKPGQIEQLREQVAKVPLPATS